VLVSPARRQEGGLLVATVKWKIVDDTAVYRPVLVLVGYRLKVPARSTDCSELQLCMPDASLDIVPHCSEVGERDAGCRPTVRSRVQATRLLVELVQTRCWPVDVYVRFSTVAGFSRRSNHFDY
jgi:hypothetical protein